MQTSQYANIAFISYKREDEEWAKWLQKKLEHYKLPTDIRKQNPDLEFANNPRHVFKDTTDLSGGVLAKAIKEGLDSSKFLIVICSPRAAKSEWVCKEVQDFIDSGREEYIIPFIIDGEPYAKNPEDECFPESLKTLADERELLGININENGREAAAVKVIARMFDVRFDTLWQRFQKEEKRRRRYTFAGIIGSILLVAGVAVWISWLESGRQSERQQKELIKSKNDSLMILNETNLAQKIEIERQRDELRIANKTLKTTNGELTASNKIKTEQLAKIEEQQRIIDKLRSQTYGEIIINDNIAGKLADKLPYNALMNVSRLTIMGDINGTDIVYIKNSLRTGNLKHLDLKGAKLLPGGNLSGGIMFSDCVNIESVELPLNIKSISNSAFEGCKNLSRIDIPNGVTIIEPSAFDGCTELKLLTIPNSVKTIGYNAFRNCSNLTNITIPNSVTEIGPTAFYGCSGLKSIIVSNGNKVYDSRDNCNAIIETATNKLIKASNSTIIPKSVNVIGIHAFESCPNLTEISIPNSVKIFEDFSFAGSALISISIPNSVTSTGKNTFHGCSDLISVIIPNGIKKIERGVFHECRKLKNISIPNSVTSIGDGAFYGCRGFDSLVIPNSITQIDDDAFRSCYWLKSIVIPNSVTKIGSTVFFGCQHLSYVFIPNSIETIGENVFECCYDLKNIYSEIKDIHRVHIKRIGDGIPSECVWHVPVGKAEDYKSQKWWEPTWMIIDDINNME